MTTLPPEHPMRVDPAKTGPARIGLWVTMLGPFGIEALAGFELDWIGIDLQHGDIPLHALPPLVRACEAAGFPVAVRIDGHDPALIARVVDGGADAVIVPAVDSAAQAAALVRAVRLPPAGARSSGISRTSLGVARAASHTLLLPMIETAAGFAALDEILCVPGVDGVFVGPYDLSLSLGTDGVADPRTIEAARKVVDSARGRGLVSGIYSGNADITSRFGDVSLLALGSDVDALRHGLGELLESAPGVPPAG
ncbi:HpcH/HpaI aldolase family protein [Microbacterium sp. ASV49]|uniref:Aldolase/citrate lyase family protein n=1 Tax=Microbacterium candidum TaxID=3041922 RepID=A0ABT7MW34_9MICO|nr:aldolase/citrate lyase family protein [Microbacterium sp. ASV49]MDL9978667.1 aldolase/citrate lyase family protein [Microbacterium sp. ASV49]